MKDNQVAHLGLASHEACLPGGQMIVAAGFLRIGIQVGCFTVEQVRVLSEGNDFRFILFVEPGIDDAGNLLPS